MTSVNQLRKDLEILKRALNVGSQPSWKKRHEELQPILARLNEIGWNNPVLREAANRSAEEYARQLEEGYRRVWNPAKGEHEWSKPT